MACTEMETPLDDMEKALAMEVDAVRRSVKLLNSWEKRTRVLLCLYCRMIPFPLTVLKKA
jgi:hypothetical protein